MTFEEAIKKIENSEICIFSGLQALGRDARRIRVSESRKINGSINLDRSLEKRYPNDNRWDYSFGYKNRSYFVEVHPAYTSEVEVVLKKLEWLREWLSGEGKPLDDIIADDMTFTWIYTSKCDIPKNTRQYRAAVQNGIIPTRELMLVC